MPVKIARSTPRPSFGLRELLVASHISRLASRDAAKALLSTLVSESSGECRLNAHRYSQIDVIALLVVASLSLQSPAFLLEDPLFFNSVNNVPNFHPLYFYNGHVAFIPEGAAYLLGFFPLVAQAVLYRVIPLAILLILYWETKRLLCLKCNTTEAALLSIAVILYIRFVEPFIPALLTFSIWSALLAAFVYVVSVSIEGRSYSLLAI